MTAVVPELRRRIAVADRLGDPGSIDVDRNDLAAVLDAAEAMAADLDTLADICGARPLSLASWRRRLTGEAD